MPEPPKEHRNGVSLRNSYASIREKEAPNYPRPQIADLSLAGSRCLISLDLRSKATSPLGKVGVVRGDTPEGQISGPGDPFESED